jgi:uncharacterized membrane protein (DUF4010 family)
MPISIDRQLVWSLVSALLLGALVGIEREKSKSASGNLGTGGVRTFILFSLTGAVATLLARTLASPLLLAAAVLAVGALVVAGHLVQARHDPTATGITTEAAAITVCLLGATSAAGYPELALAGGVTVSALLAYKATLHQLIAKLAPGDIEAGVKLLAATFIVLPLLPSEAVDPWGALRPRSLWLLVILIAAFSLVGYVATRALGPERGTAVTGLTGGLVSSTAVTLTFAKRSREEGGRTDDALAAGTFLAWAVMFARVVVIAALIYPALLRPMLAPFGAMLAATAIAALVLLRRARATPPVAGSGVALSNPFSLLEAIKFGLLFAMILLGMTFLQRRFPSGGGTHLFAALAGTSDVDAITLSMATLARDGETTAALAATSILIAVISNTLVKAAMSATLGGRRLRRAALVVALLLVAIGVVAFAAI